LTDWLAMRTQHLCHSGRPREANVDMECLNLINGKTGTLENAVTVLFYLTETVAAPQEGLRGPVLPC